MGHTDTKVANSAAILTEQVINDHLKSEVSKDEDFASKCPQYA